MQFVWCDAHPAKGGPHKSQGLFVGWHGPRHNATLWMCTHKSRRGNVCGNVQVELSQPMAQGDWVNQAQAMWNHALMWEMGS